MNSLILIALIALVPIVLALIFRVSAVFLFLSVAVGSLLVSYVGDDASLALGMMVKGQNTTLISQFALQLTPVALTLLFLKKTFTTASFVIHLVPIILTGLALGVLVLPFIDASSQQQIFSNYYGDMFKDFQDIIVAVAGISVLFLAFSIYGHTKAKSKKGKSH